MKPIPLTPETEAIARRIIWFEVPAKALSDPVRFTAYAMASAMHEDMRALRRYVSDDDFRSTKHRLGSSTRAHGPCWNSKMGCYPPPPLLKRCLR